MNDTFLNWCAIRDAKASIPVTPYILARFVSDCAELGIEKLTEIVNGVATAHVVIGLANPAATPAVNAALSAVTGIERPRSWPKDQEAEWQALPYGLQRYLAKRETERDATVRRAQNEAVRAKQAKEAA